MSSAQVPPTPPGARRAGGEGGAGGAVYLRLMTEQDSMQELTALIHRAYAMWLPQGLNFTAVDQTPEETARRARAGVCLLACQGQTVIGTISVRGPRARSQCEHFTRPDVACTGQLAVEPGLRLQGVGALLMNEAIAIARAAGFKELAGDTAESATWLLRWYQSFGFRVLSTLQWPGRNYRSVLISMRLDEDS